MRAPASSLRLLCDAGGTSVLPRVAAEPEVECLAPGGLHLADGGRAVTGWETSERVLESGAFESRQRVLVAEPVVEASQAGARTLGVTYWQAVDRFTRGGVRASWAGGGGKLKLLGGAPLLTFGPPELSFDGGV